MLPFAYRVNVSAAFPVQVVGAEGVEVSKANGIYTIGSAYETLVALGGVAATPQKFIKIWDSVTGIYNTVSMAVILGGVVNVGFSIISVTSGAGYLATIGDDLIVVNKASGSATNVTMVASATRTRGPVQIKDGKGDADTNNITVLFNGGETADGLSSLVIRTKFGAVSLAPNPAGGWAILNFG